MLEQIPGVTNFFRRKGKLAFLAGQARDEHGLNRAAKWAILDFQIGYDAAAHEAKSIPASTVRVDAAQGVA